ncbi:hypothetical protein [Paracoccus spongiarum]|uniref:Uncharacterized protein n=1 Tax=Paracoccus spongiarum TaxID=3064387 RepID=A0ABT9JDV2_9RHOB|nr:hypothetical protein [Paracoccus sp. 2205BS29-5]MDP5307895.1 hypothetical protein [Paracoccus sp. 2205BS29-5]
MATKVPQNNPPVAKGNRFPFQVSIVAWGDLLGYGRKIAEAGFNPLDERAKTSIIRMREFHRVVAEHSNRHFPSLVINDGVAAYRDLSLRGRSISHDFLERSWELFSAINELEAKRGDPGIRMVVACGFRMRGRRAKVENDHSKVNSILYRFRDGQLTAEQAIREASTARPSFDVVPQLQANFAFTKAYVAESSGRSGGLPGPNFYLDTALLLDSTCAWPSGGSGIMWRDNTLGLDTEFRRVSNLPKIKHPEGGASELRTGLEVAQFLAGDVDVLNALSLASK